MKYEFFIAGRARNKDNILKICDLLDKYNISYYCFLKNEEDWDTEIAIKLLKKDKKNLNL